MRVASVILFALSIAGLGVLSLLSGDFALNWQPVPAWIPGREALAIISGAVLVVCGLGLLVPRTAALCTLVLAIDFLIWLVLLRLAALTSLVDPGQWLGVGETAVLVCGAGALLISQADRLPFGAAIQSTASRNIVRLLFGVALPMIGLSHFVYVHATIALVPTYLPARIGFAWFTGAAHIAAGTAVLFGVVPRLAANLEGIMMGLFAVMVWLPRVAAAPMSRFAWTAMLISLAYAAASLIVAGIFKPQPLAMPREVAA